MSVERIAIDNVPAQPWKNGAGLTREVAAAPRGAPIGEFDWRVSIARIDRNAPFSAFAGVDRCITLLRGAGMRLRSPDDVIDLSVVRVAAPCRFAGDVPLAATLVDGPCDDLNVMTRRGAWQADVHAVDAARRIEAADAGLLVALSGSWHCDTADGVLHAWHAWLWRDTMPVLHVRPAGAGGLAIVVRLCHGTSA